jgi:hypothetical protein
MTTTDPRTAADKIRGWLQREPDAELFEFPRKWLRELLDERDQLAADRNRYRIAWRRARTRAVALEQLRAERTPTIVWVVQADEGLAGVWRDPDHAQRAVIDALPAEAPGVYRWVNDPDRTHDQLLRDGEPTGLTLWMAVVSGGDV